MQNMASAAQICAGIEPNYVLATMTCLTSFLRLGPENGVHHRRSDEPTATSGLQDLVEAATLLTSFWLTIEVMSAAWFWKTTKAKG